MPIDRNNRYEIREIREYYNTEQIVIKESGGFIKSTEIEQKS